MEPQKQDFTVVSRLGYEWNPEFSTPQTVSRKGQNIPFWATYEDDGNETPPDTNDLLSQFLGEIFDDAGPFLYQAVPIRDFCLAAKVSVLAAGTDVNIQRHMALVDERNDDGLRKDARGTCRRRLHDGALSASSLYKLLRKPVCRSHRTQKRQRLLVNNEAKYAFVEIQCGTSLSSRCKLHSRNQHSSQHPSQHPWDCSRNGR